jgi:hypothetical protein
MLPRTKLGFPHTCYRILEPFPSELTVTAAIFHGWLSLNLSLAADAVPTDPISSHVLDASDDQASSKCRIARARGNTLKDAVRFDQTEITGVRRGGLNQLRQLGARHPALEPQEISTKLMPILKDVGCLACIASISFASFIYIPISEPMESPKGAGLRAQLCRPERARRVLLGRRVRQR